MGLSVFFVLSCEITILFNFYSLQPPQPLVIILRGSTLLLVKSRMNVPVKFYFYYRNQLYGFYSLTNVISWTNISLRFASQCSHTHSGLGCKMDFFSYRFCITSHINFQLHTNFFIVAYPLSFRQRDTTRFISNFFQPS